MYVLGLLCWPKIQVTSKKWQTVEPKAKEKNSDGSNWLWLVTGINLQGLKDEMTRNIFVIIIS